VSDVVIVALIPAVVSLIGIIVNSRQNSVILVKANQIHELTNSNLTEVKRQLGEALDKIEVLESYGPFRK
jgi:TRAP-type uncharacterized transport system fused permease subunit